MNLDKFELLQFSFVIVFEQINRDLIRRDFLRNFFQEVTIADFPDLMVITTPSNAYQIHFDDRRAYINVTLNETPLEDKAEFLADSCINVIDAISESKILAYGFNMEGICTISDQTNIDRHLLEVCYGGGDVLRKTVNSEIISVAPAFSFMNNGARVNLALTPLSEQAALQYHCNVHFDAKLIPSQSDLINQMMSYRDYLVQILEKM